MCTKLYSGMLKTEKEPTKVNMFRAFRDRNYTLFFAGQSISQIGTWMQKTGMSWLVYAQTGSPFMLGLTIFASQFPSFIFSLYGGVVSDRYNRFKILMITQWASLIQAILMALVAFQNPPSVTGILILCAVLGIINAFDVPARQPLVHHLVKDKRDVPNALALNSAMVNLARLIGPTLSGLILHFYGAGICFLLNAISFVAVLISLSLITQPAFHPKPRKDNTLNEMKDSFRYLLINREVGTILLLLTLLSLLVWPYDTLIPIFATAIFHGDASTYGYLSGFMGLGALLGTIFLAAMNKTKLFKKILFFNTLLLSAGLLLFSFANKLPFALLFIVLIGFGAMTQTTVCLTLIQTKVEEKMRGRMISFLAMAVFGMMPIGSLLIGMLSQYIGAQNCYLCLSFIAFAIAISFSRFFFSPESNLTHLATPDFTNETIHH